MCHHGSLEVFLECLWQTICREMWEGGSVGSSRPFTQVSACPRRAGLWSWAAFRQRHLWGDTGNRALFSLSCLQRGHFQNYCFRDPVPLKTFFLCHISSLLSPLFPPQTTFSEWREISFQTGMTIPCNKSRPREQQVKSPALEPGWLLFKSWHWSWPVCLSVCLCLPRAAPGSRLKLTYPNNNENINVCGIFLNTRDLWIPPWNTTESWSLTYPKIEFVSIHTQSWVP